MRIRFNKQKIEDQLGTTLVIEDGKTLYVGNTISLYANDGSFLDIGNGGRLGALAFKDTLDGGGPGTGTVTSVAATAPAAGFTISGSPITSNGTFVFALSDDLAAVEGLSGTGITARTASNSWATRTLTGTTDQVNISNGDGVSGNPTFSLPQSIATTSSPRFASLGVGLTGSIAATLEARSTSGAQICGSYNASNLWTATTASNGAVTFDAIGLGASFTFSDPVVLNSTLNGNTITTGTGTLTLNSYTLTVSGASAINQDVTTSGTPQFALLGVGTSTVSYQGIRTVVSLSGNATQTGIVSSVTGNSSATTAIRGVYAAVQTAAAAFTCTTASAFWAQAAIAGSGSTITNCIGFDADVQTAGSMLNASFRGVNTVASGVWNLYMAGDAANYLAGGLQIGHNGSALGTFESRATSGAQIVGSYSGSSYWTATTSSTGVTTFTPTGSGACFIIAGSILLSGLTSNGFVKTSGGNGMLSIDTSTYLTGSSVDKEVPSGSIDGANTAFSLANTPVAGSEHVYLNGLLQQSGAGNDYTISGATITMAAAPLSGEKILVSYRK